MKKINDILDKGFWVYLNFEVLYISEFSSDWDTTCSIGFLVYISIRICLIILDLIHPKAYFS